ncbi:hypothetical protein BH10PSE10_BH10PSE10_21520 [soil metagenome]
MNLQQLSPVPAPLLRSVILATGIVGLLAVSEPEGIRNASAMPGKDISTPSGDLGQTSGAMAELAEAVADALIALDKPKAMVEMASAYAQDVPPAEAVPAPAPVQVASLNPSDVGPADTGKASKSIEIVDECLVVDVCIDRYLWALYQRTLKEDTIKVPERRNVAIKRKGRMVTVSRVFTRLVDQDFGWKDPKAAERTGMPMMDYVIGGMDRRFKLKLFHMLHAAEAAGLSPGITSGFRDDYRQSIASGLKAASNRSYHGGSLRGGYGRGLAADVVSVDGATRDQRWTSSDKLWKWVDAHGKEFGIARPYLGKDPPHVAPADGEEYAKHNRGTKEAATVVKRVNMKKAEVKKAGEKTAKRVATRDPSRPVKRPKTAAVSKLKAS